MARLGRAQPFRPIIKTIRAAAASTTQTILGLARIQKSVSQTITGKSRIEKSVSQTIQGLSRITKVVNQTIQGLARITVSTSQTIQGKADIAKTTNQTIQGLSRIQKSVSQVITGVSRINKVVNQTVQGIARVTVSTSQTIQGLASIVYTTTKTVQGLARIQKSVNQTIQGLARITISTSQTIVGKADISKSTPQTLTGKARIETQVNRTLLGKARLSELASQTIQGKSRISKPGSQTITGKADIKKATPRTIKGKARIITTTEFKIVNNLIVDADRESWIGDIYDTLNGLEFYPFKADTEGLGYFEIGDRLTMTDPGANDYEVVVLNMSVSLNNGFTESLSAKVPDKTSTNYNFAGIIGKRITKTEIVVDRQDAEITLINSELDNTVAQIAITTDTITSSVETLSGQVNSALDATDANRDLIDTIQSDLTSLEQTATDLTLRVEGSGGVNLLKNSVGLKGSIEEWQMFDSTGTLIDSRNNGTIDQSTDVANNTESNSAITIANQYIEQTFKTIEDELYTVYFRYKSSLACSVTITGVTGTVSVPISADWTVFKYQFTASGPSTTFRIENGSGASCTVSDIVVKIGDATGWVQAPNEVYGSNFRFDKDGFTITSLTSTFKAVLDNEKLTIYDTAGGVDKIVMQVSKDSGKVTNFTAQDELIVQRYENPDASMRIIPVDDGVFVVIND